MPGIEIINGELLEGLAAMARRNLVLARNLDADALFSVMENHGVFFPSYFQSL